MKTSDLMEYLYDIREFLDKHVDIQTEGDKTEPTVNTSKEFKTASHMVTYVIEKIKKEGVE